MLSVASQLIQEVIEHAQSDSLKDARETCADGTYFPNNLRIEYFNSRPNFMFIEKIYRKLHSAIDTKLFFSSYI